MMNILNTMNTVLVRIVLYILFISQDYYYNLFLSKKNEA